MGLPAAFGQSWGQAQQSWNLLLNLVRQLLKSPAGSVGDSIMWGRVSDTGVAFGGSEGWSSSRTGVGSYKLLFDSPLSTTATVIPVAYATVGRIAYRVNLVNEKEAVIYMSSTAALGTLADSGFQFVVIG